MRDTRYDELFWNEQHNWWYRNRRLLVYDLLRKYDVPFVAEILDVGCGTGLLLQELCERGYKHVVGLDNSRRALAYCRARNLPAVFMADAVATGCAASSFDVVLLLDVLEHITYEPEAIRETLRILKSGGICIATVPAFKFLWGAMDVQAHHYRRYRKREIQQLFEDCGFATTRVTYFNTILFVPIAYTRIFARVFGRQLVSEWNKPGLLNNLLFLLFSFERALLRFINLPFGVSLLVIAQKPTQ